MRLPKRCCPSWNQGVPLNQSFMEDNYYLRYCDSLDSALRAVEITDLNGKKFDGNDGMKQICELTQTIKAAGRKIYFCGNGASAAFASHMALDWTKNGGVVAQAFNDGVMQTALVNDLGAERMFAEPLNRYAQAGDLLTTISSSGNSPNIIEAIAEARSMGLSIVTFSGLKADNQSRRLGDFNVYLPAKTYGVVESAHQVLLHIWLDGFMGVTEWDRSGVQDMRGDHFTL